MIFCDVKSGKRCLHYSCVRCTLLVMYSWFNIATVSVSSKLLSILITFLTAPRAVELTIIDDELCPPLQPYFSLVYTWFNVHAMPRSRMAILY